MPPAELDSGSQINHDLDAVKAGLPGQAKDAIQATSVQRSGGKGNFHRKVTQFQLLILWQVQLLDTGVRNAILKKDIMPKGCYGWLRSTRGRKTWL